MNPEMVSGKLNSRHVPKGFGLTNRQIQQKAQT